MGEATRQVVLDTETTGLEASKGHRIIEIGCVEMVNRRITRNNLHLYINPEREVDEGAAAVHGMTWDDLRDKPTFAQIVDQFLDFCRGAEIIIHNASFDTGFLDAELARLGKLHASTLIVGLQTGVGRGLTGRLAAGLREVGWQLEARNIPWSDPLAGVGTKECDAGFAWLGATTDPQCDHVVVAEEPIMLAVSSDHRLAARPEVTFADIAQEALVALPAEAGVLRSFWLAEHARDDTCPATVSCLSTTADAALENVAAGRGSVLLAAGNAQLYGREGLCFLPVVDLPPARLAFLWRAADDRSIIAHAARIMGGASGDAFSL